MTLHILILSDSFLLNFDFILFSLLFYFTAHAIAFHSCSHNSTYILIPPASGYLFALAFQSHYSIPFPSHSIFHPTSGSSLYSISLFHSCVHCRQNPYGLAFCISFQFHSHCLLFYAPNTIPVPLPLCLTPVAHPVRSACHCIREQSLGQ